MSLGRPLLLLLIPDIIQVLPHRQNRIVFSHFHLGLIDLAPVLIAELPLRLPDARLIVDAIVEHGELAALLIALAHGHAAPGPAVLLVELLRVRVARLVLAARGVDDGLGKVELALGAGAPRVHAATGVDDDVGRDGDGGVKVCPLVRGAVVDERCLRLLILGVGEGLRDDLEASAAVKRKGQRRVRLAVHIDSLDPRRRTSVVDDDRQLTRSADGVPLEVSVLVVLVIIVHLVFICLPLALLLLALEERGWAGESFPLPELKR